MKRLGLVLACLFMVDPSHAAELKRVPFKGLVDGASLGDLDGDGQSEIVALLRNGSAADPKWTNGSVVALDTKGGLLWERKGATPLTGSVTTADFDGDGKREVAYCDGAAAGHCFVLKGDGQLLWQTKELYYPAVTGMAPAASDLTQDGVVDLVTATWGGSVAAYDGPSGVEIWRYEAYRELGELFHCNPLLVDANGDQVDDVLVIGAQKGYIIALDGTDGHVLWKTEAMQQKYGNYSRGNGILVAELRSGSGNEFMVAMRGATANDSAVFGVARDGSLLFRSPIAGLLSYMTPVSADVTGDGRAEIYLQSRNGVLSRLDGKGNVLASLNIGAESWVSPAFVDADQDGTVEIIASSTTGVKILKGAALTVVDELANFAQGLQPSPVVADVERDGKAEFFMGSWYGTELFRVQLTGKSWSRWDSLGGTSRHQGQHPVSVYHDVSQPGINLASLEEEVARAAEALPRAAEREAERAADDIEEALTMLLTGEPHSAVRAFRSAEKNLRDAGSSLNNQNAQMVQIAVTAARQSLARFNALFGFNNSQLKRANDYLKDADTLFKAGNFKDALLEVQQAYTRMDQVSGTVSNHCIEVEINEPYLALECEFLSSVLRISTSDYWARTSALSGVESMALLDIASAASSLERAIGRLRSGDPEVANITHTLRKLARLYLDDMKIAGGTRLQSAEVRYQSGMTALAAGDLQDAAEYFSAAIELAER